jgi:hypothetical protein
MTVSKYGNKRTQVDGNWFHSAAEAKHWIDLKLLERAGEITDVKRQVPFELRVEGVLICKYIADFTYTDKADKFYVIDVKGFRTPEYKLKAKLMAATGYPITEIGVERKAKRKLKVAS